MKIAKEARKGSEAASESAQAAQAAQAAVDEASKKLEVETAKLTQMSEEALSKAAKANEAAQQSLDQATSASNAAQSVLAEASTLAENGKASAESVARAEAAATAAAIDVVKAQAAAKITKQDADNSAATVNALEARVKKQEQRDAEVTDIAKRMTEQEQRNGDRDRAIKAANDAAATNNATLNQLQKALSALERLLSDDVVVDEEGKAQIQDILRSIADLRGSVQSAQEASEAALRASEEPLKLSQVSVEQMATLVLNSLQPQLSDLVAQEIPQDLSYVPFEEPEWLSHAGQLAGMQQGSDASTSNGYLLSSSANRGVDNSDSDSDSESNSDTGYNSAVDSSIANAVDALDVQGMAQKGMLNKLAESFITMVGAPAPDSSRTAGEAGALNICNVPTDSEDSVDNAVHTGEALHVAFRRIRGDEKPYYYYGWETKPNISPLWRDAQSNWWLGTDPNPNNGFLNDGWAMPQPSNNDVLVEFLDGRVGLGRVLRRALLRKNQLKDDEYVQFVIARGLCAALGPHEHPKPGVDVLAYDYPRIDIAASRPRLDALADPPVLTERKARKREKAL